jgi:hypothetical protein
VDDIDGSAHLLDLVAFVADRKALMSLRRAMRGRHLQRPLTALARWLVAGGSSQSEIDATIRCFADVE